jgi:hypothetical protein
LYPAPQTLHLLPKILTTNPVFLCTGGNRVAAAAALAEVNARVQVRLALGHELEWRVEDARRKV